VRDQQICGGRDAAIESRMAAKFASCGIISDAATALT
jgi:hypothetical protein